MTAPEAGWHPVTACDLCNGKDLEFAFRRAVDDRQLDRCTGCGLVFLKPRPSPEVIARWYQDNYFTGEGAVGMGASYLEHADAGIRHGTEAFMQFSRRFNVVGARMLEIGCGGGAFIVQCRNAGAQVCGLEISEFAAVRLRERYRLDVRVGVAEAAPFEPGTFDCVAFTDVIEHVPSPAAFMPAIHRLLKPGGRVFGLLPNLDCVAYYGTAWGGFRQHAEHLYYFGRQALERLLKQAGFEIEEFWTHGEPWEPPEGGTAATSPQAATAWKERLRGLPGVMPTVRTLRRVRGWFDADKRARRARYRKGLGHDLYFLGRKN